MSHGAFETTYAAAGDRYERLEYRRTGNSGLRLAPLSVTIEGFGGQGDPRKVARLRAAINATCRVAAGDRRTSYHATSERITIGIAGPDARERIAVLRRQLAKIGGSRGWTITEDLN
ncbi:hypothetical protein [Spongiactinospora sp. TRM90649]|uniref:hypothetical protein n=1 Tax=Spongiactinospora sp. TRM90649 TaxID=3031114 RepID=UPI0023F7259D|nr:hypothetical protein [Spongiactinospora sp. TRM90649]MDF5757433.1 hypothetical protein [Spongiactinospora sp. TRM90649]